MKVKLTKMHFIQGRGRVYPGEVIDWAGPLSRFMVPVDAPVAKAEPAPIHTPVALSEIAPPSLVPVEEPRKPGRPRKTQSDREVL